MLLTRRTFLGRSAASLGVLSFGANPLLGLARSNSNPTDHDRILVVLQLTGGNDGLSTLIPHGDDAYGRNRKTTRIPTQDVLKIDEHLGFHPGLAGLMDLYEDRRVGIIPGVGYPNPIRSHFESMDVWHAADLRGRRAGHGWIGKLADQVFAGSSDPDLVIHVGDKLPFSLHASRYRPIAFSSKDTYRWRGPASDLNVLEKAVRQPSENDKAPASESEIIPEAISRMRRTVQGALSSSNQVLAAVDRYKAAVPYPPNPFGAALSTVSALISGGLRTKIYSLDVGGFDTHSQQKWKHDKLMTALGLALDAFMKDLVAHRQDHRVVLLTVSEFGRRVKENASRGTDHGAACPLFLLGKPVKPGLRAPHPSLTELDDQGDLVYSVDFRRVYATLIDEWLGGRHQDVLGQEWKKLNLL